MPFAAVATLGGAYLGYRGASEQADAQNRASRDARNAAAAGLGFLDNATYRGPGGGFSAFGGNGINVDLGDLDPVRKALIGSVQHNLYSRGLPGYLPQAFNTAAQANQQGINTGLNGLPQADVGLPQTGQGLPDAFSGLPTADIGNFGTINSNVADVLGNAFSGVNNAGNFQTGLANQSFGVAGSQLGDIGTSQQATQTALQGLRAQALPQQQQQVASTFDKLFSQGRLGTTGGANILGQLQQAQNQQDLGFQLAALQEGRNTQQNALGLAQGSAGLGANVTGLGEQLLQGAFNRFGQTAGLASDLNTQQYTRNLDLSNTLFGRQLDLSNTLFGRQFDLNNTGFNRNLAAADFARSGLNTNFQQALQQATFGQNLDQSRLNQALAGLQGIGGLDQSGLSGLQAALALQQSRANAATGQASNLTSLVNNPNYGASPLTGIGTALLNNSSSIGNYFSGLGNNNSTPPPGDGGFGALFTQLSNNSG